jgi:hypothetical protein
MATFIPQVTDQFPQQQLYTPDYNFLMQGYAQKQGQYDRGFSAVKNMYNSLLNSTLSNSENIEHRNEVFKSIQNRIRSISGMDLSNSSTVSQAFTTFDPLTSDQDIVYDMNVTASTQKQMALADQQRNSTDPKVREMFNPTSVEDLNYVIQDLKEAKRGDGSIQSVNPRKYIPFVDVLGTLYKSAKEQNFEIVESSTQGGYILKRTNGIEKAPVFQEWAKSVIGSNPLYQEQLQLLGRVSTRRDINTIMSRTGATKNQARELIAINTAAQIKDSKLNQIATYNKELTKIDQSLAFLKKKYQEGGLTPKEVETLELIKKQKAGYKTFVEGVQHEISEIDQGDISHLANNLESIYSEKAFESLTGNFARSYATLTEKQSIEVDNVVLAKWRLENDALDRMQREKLAYMEQDRADRRAMFNNEAALQLARAKGELKGTEGEHIGYYTKPGTPTSAITRQIETYNQEMDAVYDLAFSSTGALGAIPDIDQSKVYPTIYKIREISLGKPVKLTDADVSNLRELGQKFQMKMFNPANAPQAKALLRNLTLGIKDYASNSIENDFTDNKAKNASEINKRLNALVGQMSMASNSIGRTEDQLVQISKAITNPDGTLKQQYEGAKLMGYSRQGHPLYDTSTLDEAKHQELSAFLPEHLKNTVYSTKIMQYNLTPAAASAIFQGGIGASVTINDEDVTEDYATQTGNAAIESLQTLMGKGLAESLQEATTVEYDADTKTATFVFGIDPASSTTKALPSLKEGEMKIKVKVPYSSLQKIGALSTFATHAQDNTAKNFSLGLSEALYANPNGSFTLPRSYSSAGVDFKVNGQTLSNSYNIIIDANIEQPNGEILSKRYNYPDIDIEPGTGLPSKERLSNIEADIYKIANSILEEKSKFVTRNNSASRQDLISTGLTFE